MALGWPHLTTRTLLITLLHALAAMQVADEVWDVLIGAVFGLSHRLL